jgi:hypothetical protein
MCMTEMDWLFGLYLGRVLHIYLVVLSFGLLVLLGTFLTLPSIDLV